MRNKEKERGLDAVKLTDKGYLRTLETAIRFGRAILLENIQESLDAAVGTERYGASSASSPSLAGDTSMTRP